MTIQEQFNALGTEQKILTLMELIGNTPVVANAQINGRLDWSNAKEPCICMNNFASRKHDFTAIELKED